MAERIAFQIDCRDNVATALTELPSGTVMLIGDADIATIDAMEKIPAGHKIALCDIVKGDKIIKYGVTIGVAAKTIKQGQWVHLHNMKSCVDERSSHLDTITGELKDIAYE